MTDSEALEYYNKLVEYYGKNKLANPIHYPKMFQNQVKLYRYYNEPKVNEEDEKQKDEQQVHETKYTSTEASGTNTSSSGDNAAATN